MSTVDFDAPPKNGHGAAPDEAWEAGPPEGFGDEGPEAPESGAAASPWAERISAVSAEWITTPPARRVWLLRDSRRPHADGVLPLGKVGEIIAEGGIGKSMLNVQLACAVATGAKWLGTLTVPEAGRALVILGEEDAEEARRRLYNAAHATGAVTSAAIAAISANVVTLPLAGVPCPMIETIDRNPVDAPFLNWLRDYVVTSGPWKLIVVDPLSRFAGQDAETDNAAATRFVQALESLASISGATVLTSHHTNKPSRGDGALVDTSSSRGSTALTDGVRWVATMGAGRAKMADRELQERLGEIVTLSFTKSNYGRKADPILLRRDLDHGGALVPLDETDRELLAAERAASDPRVQRAADRQRLQAEREAKESARRADRAASSLRQAAERREAEDAALRACLIRDDGLNEDALISAMRAYLGKCSHDAAKTAIARARSAGWIEIRSGAKNAKRHHLVRP